MDSDRSRYIFWSITISFEITRISVSFLFPTISYQFCFREKIKNKSDLASYQSFSSLFMML